MEIPTHLSHKPIVKLENYHEVDGRFANHTDAQGLSVGIAQWNDVGDADLSVKVWRHSDKRWSRQSEEIPPHRVIDLASLLCSALSLAKDGVMLGDEEFQVTSSRDGDLLNKLKQGLEKEQPHLDKSLARLAKMLKQLGY